MIWHLLHTSGRVFARGSRAHVLSVAEEMGVARVLTCGGHTADPASMPQMLSREFRVDVVRNEGASWKAAA